MSDHDLNVGHLTCCQVCGATDLEPVIDLARAEHAPEALRELHYLNSLLNIRAYIQMF